MRRAVWKYRYALIDIAVAGLQVVGVLMATDRAEVAVCGGFALLLTWAAWADFKRAEKEGGDGGSQMPGPEV